jgi:hypothetical protein
VEGEVLPRRGCCGSTGMGIVAPKRSWREIFCEKLGTDTKEKKQSKKKEAGACKKDLDRADIVRDGR